jgi:hypothetical protein
MRSPTSAVPSQTQQSQPGDTAFGEQRVERYEEVEVYAGEVHPSF